MLLSELVHGREAHACLLLDDPRVGRVHVSRFRDGLAHMLRRVHGLRPFHFDAHGLAMPVHVADVAHVPASMQTEALYARVVQSPLQIGFHGGFHARAVILRGLATALALLAAHWSASSSSASISHSGHGMGRAGYNAHPCLGHTGSTSGGSIHSRIRSQALRLARPTDHRPEPATAAAPAAAADSRHRWRCRPGIRLAASSAPEPSHT